MQPSCSFCASGHRHKLVKISWGARSARIIGGRRCLWVGGTMASAEHEPISGVRAPAGSRDRGPGQGDKAP